MSRRPHIRNTDKTERLIYYIKHKGIQRGMSVVLVYGHPSKIQTDRALVAEFKAVMVSPKITVITLTVITLTVITLVMTSPVRQLPSGHKK